MNGLSRRQCTSRALFLRPLVSFWKIFALNFKRYTFMDYSEFVEVKFQLKNLLFVQAENSLFVKLSKSSQLQQLICQITQKTSEILRKHPIL